MTKTKASKAVTQEAAKAAAESIPEMSLIDAITILCAGYETPAEELISQQARRIVHDHAGFVYEREYVRALFIKAAESTRKAEFDYKMAEDLKTRLEGAANEPNQNT